jgi:hypothetical protein
VSTEDCISDLFLWVASMMTDAPKRPDARLHPSDLVTWRCASRSRAWGRAPSTHGCARTTVTTVGRAPLVTGLGGSRSGPSMRYVGRRRGRWRAYHARKAGRCLGAWWLRAPAHGQPPLCRSAPSTCHTYARISHAGCSGCDRRASEPGRQQPRLPRRSRRDRVRLVICVAYRRVRAATCALEVAGVVGRSRPVQRRGSGCGATDDTHRHAHVIRQHPV